MIAGAAPLPGQIEEFMRVTSCSIVVQGYGKSFRRILPWLTSVLWIKVHTNSSSAEISIGFLKLLNRTLVVYLHSGPANHVVWLIILICRAHWELCRMLHVNRQCFLNDWNSWPSCHNNRSTIGVCPWNGLRCTVRNAPGWDLFEGPHHVLWVLQAPWPHWRSVLRWVVPYRWKNISHFFCS